MKYNFAMNNCIIISVAILCIIGILAKALKSTRHKRYIKTSKKIQERLREISFPGAKLNYLRKINPYVFEELLLSCFEQQGHAIQRNKRYSGDCGLDGMVQIEKQWYLLQAKRYRSHINLQHVKDFIEVCRKKNLPGFFVHTGKTGKASKLIVPTTIQIISGSKLLDLVH